MERAKQKYDQGLIRAIGLSPAWGRKFPCCSGAQDNWPQPVGDSTPARHDSPRAAVIACAYLLELT